MASSTLSLLSLLAASFTFWYTAHAEAQPRVLGLQFSKHDARDFVTSASTGLQRRAALVPAAIQNAQGNLLYLVNVTVGNPPQNMGLQLDTGSSDVWLPYTGSSACLTHKRCSNGAYDPNSSRSYNLLLPGGFEISYVDGTKIVGDYFSDSFGINGSTVQNLTMGLALKSSNDGGGIFQGIIGVGFAEGEAIASQTGKTYPDILQVMKKQGLIATQAYSLWLNDLKSSMGTVLFGGIDEAKYHGNLSVLPIQPDAQDGQISSFTVVFDNMAITGVNGTTQYSKSNLATPVILDSGTSLTYIPDDLANDIARGVGAQTSKEYGTIVPCDLMYTPATIKFGFGSANGPVITAAISEFVLPWDAGDKIPMFKGTKKFGCRWGILPSGNSPNLFGDTFLRSAYVVYNLEGQQIGIAQTNFNATGSNVKEITQTSSIPNAATTVVGVAVSQTATVVSLATDFLSASATATATETLDSSPTATFNLGQPTAMYPGEKGAAPAVKAPTSAIAAVLVVLAAFF